MLRTFGFIFAFEILALIIFFGTQATPKNINTPSIEYNRNNAEAVLYKAPQYSTSKISHLPVVGEVTIHDKTYYMVGE